VDNEKPLAPMAWWLAPMRPALEINDFAGVFVECGSVISSVVDIQADMGQDHTVTVVDVESQNKNDAAE